MTVEPYTPGMPLMEPEEIALIEKYLTPKTVMLEWGSGGSTSYFGAQVAALYSIEHDPEWYDIVTEETASLPVTVILSENQSEDGKVVPWPECRNKPSLFTKYVEAVKSFGVNHFDVVLIDGRSRAACAQQALDYISSDSIVFIHDFWSRPEYRPALQNYTVIAGDVEDFEAFRRKSVHDKVEKVSTLVALQKTPNLTEPDDDELETMWEQMDNEGGAILGYSAPVGYDITGCEVQDKVRQ